MHASDICPPFVKCNLAAWYSLRPPFAFCQLSYFSVIIPLWPHTKYVIMGFPFSKEWLKFWKNTASVEAAAREPHMEDEDQETVKDGSVDLKGRRVLRSCTGGWRASLFIIGVEFSERLTYYGIAANLIIYLTTVMHEGVATSAKNVNNWTGVTTVMPILGGFLADAYSGRYWMVLISSIIYLLGLILLTLSVSLSALKPPRCDKIKTVECGKATPTQIGVFFLALYMISFGTGGHKPSLQAFGADQFDEENEDEAKKKTSFFNWWFFGLISGVLLAVTVVVYIQTNISWGLGFGIPTVTMVIAIILFLYGTPFYRHKIPSGSPITSIAQVVVAAIRNRNIGLPSDMKLLYENSDVESRVSGQRHLSHTQNLKFLDKAAIVQEAQNEPGRVGSINPWKVCTVTQVEETKLILRIVPIWLSCLIFGINVAQATTLFVKQGNTMDRRIGSHFEIPPASLLAFSAISMLIFVAVYDRCFVPMAQSITGNERGISILQRIGVGMFISILCMMTAALTESKRLNVVKKNGLLDNPRATVPLSVFWLIPQFVLNGIGDVFTVVGLQEYFYDQVPDTMRSLGIAFYLSVIGVSSFISSLVITIVDKATGRGGRQSWFVNNLNRCRLDYFYWLLSILSAINLCFYVYLADRYTYKKKKQITSQLLPSPSKESTQATM